MVSISSYEHSRRLHAQPWFQFVSEFIQKDDRVFLKIGHIIEEIPIGSQEDTWQLLYRDERIHVLHPIAHLLSYRVRSITGLRPKDKNKVHFLAQKLKCTFSPEEWERFESWIRFEERVRTEMTFKRVLSDLDLRLLTMLIGKHSLAALEKVPKIIQASQNLHGPIGSIAAWGLRHSRPSLKNG